MEEKRGVSMADELCSELEELTFHFDYAKYCRTEVFELGNFNSRSVFGV